MLSLFVMPVLQTGDFFFKEFFGVCRQFFLLLFEIALLSPLLSVKLFSQLFEFILENTVTIAANIYHLFVVSVPLTNTFMNHLNQLLISIILLITELLCNLFDNSREVMLGKRFE